MVFLVDPHRRKKGISFFMNPVMVKEFRTRRFGRTHWLLRLVAVSAVFSLYLTYAATTGTIDWGVETIGGIMVVLQVALVVVITPSLAANLISAERESGGWDLLMMTPLSAVSILRGEAGQRPSDAVAGPVRDIARLSGHDLDPSAAAVAGVASLDLPGLDGLVCRPALGRRQQPVPPRRDGDHHLLRPAGTVCFGTMLFWLGRDTTFGHATVESALKINPMAAALTIIEAPGFTTYNLVPANWWWMGACCIACGGIVLVQTWRLTRPE